MAHDYGLTEMTGILPVVVVAGTATMMMDRMFPREGRGQKRSRRRKSRRSSGVGFGDFSNVGL